MSDKQDAKKPENNENEQSDELAIEELDQVVGGGKKHTPPEKPTESLQLNYGQIAVTYTHQ